MSVEERHAERGQTIPFWAFAIAMTLSLIFFVYNYGNTIRYQIRAQNAADSAATAALAGDAARLNSVQTLLMALNVQEFTVRNVIAGVPQLLTGGDSNCSGSGLLTPSCTNDLLAAVNNVQAEVGNLASVATALNTFSGQLTGNNVSNIPGTVSSFFSNNCVALATDCAFKYTTKVSIVNGLPTVDEYACEKVPTLEAVFLPNAPQTYDAVGHTSYTLAPLAQNLSQGNAYGGLTNTILSGNLSLFPNIAGNAIVGTFAGLNLDTGYYAPVPTASTQSVSAKTLC
jgi:Putative Flp pilus-assembly TadE/G-like